ncbi:COX15/CtaA family protein [Vibrio gallicus]|uniref:COX15/CtaA family protein n=1 Tax=Vibrio gallicus TaxID=190897 RepID=UPI0021C41E42|nr:COX15/CtaA family protein [Vibrio gallicus]
MQGRILIERRLQSVTMLALVVTFMVIGLGAYTRLADAGLGCPDWPGCYGQLTVPTHAKDVVAAEQLFPERPVESNKAWLEMVHRYFAGTLGTIVFALSLLVWRYKPDMRGIAVAMSVLIVMQAALGMWTVTLKLMPVIVMLHLLGGFGLFCILSLVCCRLRFSRELMMYLPAKPLSTLRCIVAVATLILLVQIMLGGWTSSNYAALMCTSLPICQGQWVSHLDFENAFTFIQPEHDSYEFGVLDYGARMTIHISHRIGAMITSFSLLIAIVFLVRSKLSILQRLAKVIAIGLLIQVWLGIANVVFHLPLINAVMHNLGAALLLVTLVAANHALWARVVIAPISSVSTNKELSL